MRDGPGSSAPFARSAPSPRAVSLPLLFWLAPRRSCWESQVRGLAGGRGSGGCTASLVAPSLPPSRSTGSTMNGHFGRDLAEAGYALAVVKVILFTDTTSFSTS